MTSWLLIIVLHNAPTEIIARPASSLADCRRQIAEIRYSPGLLAWGTEFECYRRHAVNNP